MNTTERIDADMKTAMKEKDELKLSVVRMLRSALKNAAIDKGELSEENVVTILASEAKKLRDALQQFKDGGREDLAEKTEKEIAIVETYLPAQLSDDELMKIVEEKKSELGASMPQDFGKLMGAVMSATKGQADGNRVSAMVKSVLSPQAE